MGMARHGLSARTLEPNPIFMREIRTRWRSWRLLIWPAAGVIVSAGALGWVITTKQYVRAEAALVWAVVGAQIAFVLAAAPALAAAGIAAERRTGNLDLMRITRLSVHQIVLGKVLACLHPLALTFFCQLPLLVYISQARPVGPAPIAAYALALEVAALLACAGIGVAAMAETGSRLRLVVIYGVGILAPCSLAITATPLVAASSPVWAIGVAPFVLLVGAPVYVITVDAVSRRFEQE